MENGLFHIGSSEEDSEEVTFELRDLQDEKKAAVWNPKGEVFKQTTAMQRLKGNKEFGMFVEHKGGWCKSNTEGERVASDEIRDIGSYQIREVSDKYQSKGFRSYSKYQWEVKTFKQRRDVNLFMFWKTTLAVVKRI